MRITRRATMATGLAAIAASRAYAATQLKATWNGWPESQVRPPFDAFNAASPGVSASYELIPFSDLFQTLEIRLGARTPDPDLYSCDSPLTASYAVRGQGMNLDDVLDKSQFSAAAVEAASWRGKMFSAPFSTSSQLLFYNRAFFKKTPGSSRRRLTSARAGPGSRWWRPGARWPNRRRTAGASSSNRRNGPTSCCPSASPWAAWP